MADGSPTPWSAALARVANEPDYIDLTDSRFHENGLLPDSRIFREEFERWLQQRTYTPDSRGALSARRAVAKFYRNFGAAVDENDVFLTAGTSEAYFLLFTNFAQAGDVVALPRPGYPLFEHLAERARLRTVFYDQPFEWQQPPPDGLKMVVLISPNNPTGKVYSPTELEAIGNFCRQKDILLVCDEVFDAFTFDGSPPPRPAALLPDVKTLTLNGISKRFGSPDLKLAWIALTGPDTWKSAAAQTLDFANDLFLSANSYSQHLLPSLFESMDGWQQQVRSLLANNRSELSRWLEDHPEIVAPPGQGGIHGLLRWPHQPRGWDDERWSVHLLENHHLGLHPGFFYDVKDRGVLVYSLLKRPEVFREGLARLSSACSGLAALR